MELDSNLVAGCSKHTFATMQIMSTKESLECVSKLVLELTSQRFGFGFQANDMQRSFGKLPKERIALRFVEEFLRDANGESAFQVTNSSKREVPFVLFCSTGAPFF